MTNIKLDSHEGFVRITLDNGVICLALLPQLGGKIISLVRLDSGREYLVSLHDTQRSFRAPSYGGIFMDYHNADFYQRMPTIDACRYPTAGSHCKPMPAHVE